MKNLIRQFAVGSINNHGEAVRKPRQTQEKVVVLHNAKGKEVILKIRPPQPSLPALGKIPTGPRVESFRDKLAKFVEKPQQKYGFEEQLFMSLED